MDGDSQEAVEADDSPEPQVSGTEWLAAGPPGWYTAVTWILTCATALCLGASVMEQWFLWLIVLGNAFGNWAGLALGAVIWLSQMILMFQERQPDKTSCELPERPMDD